MFDRKEDQARSYANQIPAGNGRDFFVEKPRFKMFFSRCHFELEICSTTLRMNLLLESCEYTRHTAGASATEESHVKIRKILRLVPRLRMTLSKPIFFESALVELLHRSNYSLNRSWSRWCKISRIRGIASIVV